MRCRLSQLRLRGHSSVSVDLWLHSFGGRIAEYSTLGRVCSVRPGFGGRGIGEFRGTLSLPISYDRTPLVRLDVDLLYN